MDSGYHNLSFTLCTSLRTQMCWMSHIGFAPTFLPLLISSLPGHVLGMSPWCLHMPTLLWTLISSHFMSQKMVNACQFDPSRSSVKIVFRLESAKFHILLKISVWPFADCQIWWQDTRADFRWVTNTSLLLHPSESEIMHHASRMGDESPAHIKGDSARCNIDDVFSVVGCGRHGVWVCLVTTVVMWKCLLLSSGFNRLIS